MDPAFSSPTFVTREKLVSIDQQFLVDDASGGELLHVRRPVHFVRSLGALAAAALVFVVAGVGFGAVSMSLEWLLPASLRPAVLPIGVVAAIAATVGTYVRLNPRWELVVTAADAPATPLLTVHQQRSLWPFPASFDVRNAAGELLGSIRTTKLRSCWNAREPDGANVVRAWRPIVPRRLSQWFRRGEYAFEGPTTEGGPLSPVGEWGRRLPAIRSSTLTLSAELEAPGPRQLAVALGLILHARSGG